MAWWEDIRKKQSKVSRTAEPCEKCKTNRWKTKEKGKVYECRKCGHLRSLS
jgi:ribosomal protein L37AE/L43A